MAGRPRTISDRRIMAAVASAIGKVGPARLTLADVAREAQVSTGALVQRYGSKRELLLGFLRAGVAGSLPVRGMRAAYESTPDPIEGLIRAVLSITGEGGSAEEFANHLAFLHLELADPEFRALLARYATAVRGELVSYLADAADAELIEAGHVHALAAAVDALLSGTQIAWAMTREGLLVDAIRRDLTTLLSPYQRLAQQARGDENR